MKFIVDINVGKLAKLLRMIGYDALLFNGSDDSDMIAIALAEGRIILTKDRELLRRRVITSGKVRAKLVESTDPDEQLKEVIRTFGLSTSRRFTRCLECNSELRPTKKEWVKDRVPPYVFMTQSEFHECPLCHKLYWKGTHWERMTKRIKRATMEEESPKG